MAYLSRCEMESMNFGFLGKEVKISKSANIYNPEMIEIGDYSRIDDFCLISGRVVIGKYNHVTPMCMLAGGNPGIYMDDFVTLAYGVKIFAQSDDYTGESMVGSLVPKAYKNEIFSSVKIYRQVVIGTNSVLFPGVEVGEGCSIGAMTLVTKNLEPWGIYCGSPARRIRSRSKKMLELETNFLKGKEL